MPRSKRPKLVALTKVCSKSREIKDKLIQGIHEELRKHKSVYLFCVENMRNTPLKELRAEFSDSRFFFGKTKVMAKAIEQVSCNSQGLKKLCAQLRGPVGMLFTSRPEAEVKTFFDSFCCWEFARSGCLAVETVIIPPGPVGVNPEEHFKHSIEPLLRKLGMPTVLKNGIVHLEQEYLICSKGKPLTCDQAHLLKLMEIRQAQFRLKLTLFYDSESDSIKQM